MSDITGTSVTPQENLKEKIKELMPEVFTEGKIDWERLKAVLGEDINFSNERYVLNWAGKSDAFRVLQAPTTQTLVPVKEESVNFDDTEHLFIEGENLQVLKVLQKSYFGKVKMIYIDPPYNTGNDSFIYPDRFAESKDEYQKRVGDKDEAGYMTREGLFRTNSKENGQYHSNWLNMMYPRLYLAKNLLREDGVIFISIDDNEVHNLRLLMNEIFGEENFITSFIWKSRQIVDSRAKNGVSNDHEYLLVFGKTEQAVLRGRSIDLGKYSNPDDDVRGPWMSNSILGLATASQRPNLHYKITDPSSSIEYDCPKASGWRYSKETMQQKIDEERIVFPKKPEGRPREKKFLKELKDHYTNISSVLSEDIGYTLNGSREVREILGDNLFPFPKPVSLIKALIAQAAYNDRDIILDFFSGSASTAHAVFESNIALSKKAKFICVQLPEACEEKSEAYEAGYRNIADIAKERIRKVAKKISEENPEYEGDLGFKSYKLQDSNFKQWQEVKISDPDTLSKQLEIFVNPLSDTADTQHIVYELLLKSGKDLNSKIEEKDGYYLINDSQLVFMLEDATDDIIEAVIDHKPEKVIALDMIFEKKDQLKTNTVLQMKDAGIEFKTL